MKANASESDIGSEASGVTKLLFELRVRVSKLRDLSGVMRRGYIKPDRRGNADWSRSNYMTGRWTLRATELVRMFVDQNARSTQKHAIEG